MFVPLTESGLLHPLLLWFKCVCSERERHKRCGLPLPPKHGAQKERQTALESEWIGRVGPSRPFSHVDSIHLQQLWTAILQQASLASSPCFAANPEPRAGKADFFLSAITRLCPTGTTWPLIADPGRVPNTHYLCVRLRLGVVPMAKPQGRWAVCVFSTLVLVVRFCLDPGSAMLHIDVSSGSNMGFAALTYKSRTAHPVDLAAFDDCALSWPLHVSSMALRCTHIHKLTQQGG